MFVTSRFSLSGETKALLRSLKPNFGYGGFGSLTYYRTYSREIYDWQVALVTPSKSVDEPAKFDVIHDGFHDSFEANMWLTEQYNRRQLVPDDLSRYAVRSKVVGQEHWADTVIRVIEGVLSIRLDWYVKNHIAWNEKAMQSFARDMALSFFDMHWCPPGRGLWAMGTPFVYERGGGALNNCGAVSIGETPFADIHWVMDMLMLGCGIGYEPVRDDKFKLYEPDGTIPFEVPDTREGWCDLIKATGEAFQFGQPLPVPDYRLVRKEGELIRGFGGRASGPGPLDSLYRQVIQYCRWYIAGHTDTGIPYDSVMLKSDVANSVGVCVVAGNVRRSAQLACANIGDKTFINLKDYTKYPYRKAIGWMANMSVKLTTDDDFDKLGEVASRVIERGDPGYINMRNFPYGRIGKFNENNDFGVRPDPGTLLNPCAEIVLESFELCNISDTVPTRAMAPTADMLPLFGKVDQPIDYWLKACEYATFYCSTVSLLLTHRPETNAVMARNRRIGVGLVDVVGWKYANGTRKITRWMRDGYALIRKVNKAVNEEAGVPTSIRVSTLKPGGSTTKLMGRTPGVGYRNFKYMLRRINIPRLGRDGQFSTLYQILHDAGVPHEVSRYTPDTTEVFEFPTAPTDNVKTALEASIWEQAANVCLIQREWSDNSVSTTINFRPRWYVVEKEESTPLPKVVFTPDGKRHAVAKLSNVIQDRLRVKDNSEYRVTREDEYGHDVVKIYKFDPKFEEDDIEAVLAHIAPLTKAAALLPQSPAGTHPQMPEEGITEEEYRRRLKAIKPIDWSTFSNSDGEDEKYCTSDSCQMPKMAAKVVTV